MMAHRHLQLVVSVAIAGLLLHLRCLSTKWLHSHPHPDFKSAQVKALPGGILYDQA